VTGSHNNTISISKRLVSIVVDIEHASPLVKDDMLVSTNQVTEGSATERIARETGIDTYHSGPEVISSCSEQKLKDASVEVVIETSAILSWLVVGAMNKSENARYYAILLFQWAILT
jgi:hypothetical protein